MKMRKTLRISMALLLISACSNKVKPIKGLSLTPAPQKTQREITFEYGSDVNLLEFQTLYVGGFFQVDTPKVDTMKMGTSTYMLKTNGPPTEVTVLIEDTQAPVFDGEDIIDTIQGDNVDLSKHVSAKDPVDGDVEVNFDKSDFSEVGEHTVIATAIDKNENKSNKEFIVNVKEKKIVKSIPQAPSNSGSTSGSTSDSNNSESTSSGNSSSNNSESTSGEEDNYWDPGVQYPINRTLPDGTFIEDIDITDGLVSINGRSLDGQSWGYMDGKYFGQIGYLPNVSYEDRLEMEKIMDKYR